MSAKIEYNGSTVATVESGKTATLPVVNKKMATNIKVIAEKDIPNYFDGTINIESGFTTISGSYLIDQQKACDALQTLTASKTYAVEFSAGSIMNGEQETKGFISMTFDIVHGFITYGTANGPITAFSTGDYMIGTDGFAPYNNAGYAGNGARVNFYEGTEVRKEFYELFMSIADEYVE